LTDFNSDLPVSLIHDPVRAKNVAYAGGFYPPQTKIWGGGTEDEMQICEALFKGVSSQFYPYQTKIWEGETKDENGSWPKFTTHALETGFTNLHLIFCSVW